MSRYDVVRVTTPSALTSVNWYTEGEPGVTLLLLHLSDDCAGLVSSFSS